MKHLVIELIKCDLINAKMINSFNRMNIEASFYRVNIAPVIFALMGVEEENRTEELYTKYFDLLEEYENYDSTKGGLKAVTNAIYNKLRRISA